MGRRTRSQATPLGEQGNQAEDEGLRYIPVDLSDDSADLADHAGENSGAASRRLPSGGKVGKWIRRSGSIGGDEGIDDDDSRPPDVDDEVVRSGRGRGRGRRGRGRGRGRGPAREEGDNAAVLGRGRGKRDMRRKLAEAERAYLQDTHPKIRRIVDHLEEEALQEQSDPEMVDWEHYLPDPGHTRGRMSLYKQSLHVYWGLKRLLAKSMEQVAPEMVDIAQANLQKELKNLQITLMMQDRKLDKLTQLIRAAGIAKVDPDLQPEDTKQ